MSQAVSRPGIDPRVWLTLAIITERGFDPKEGVFADLQFMPGGEKETAYYGTSYAGAGFGEHNPLKVGDTVLVGVPCGDTGLGPVIIARFNSASDPPPTEFGEGDEPSDDRILRVEPGQNLRIYVSKGAKVAIVAEDLSTVQLGAEDLLPVLNGVVQGEGIDPFTGMTQAVLGNASQVVLAKKSAI